MLKCSKLIVQKFRQIKIDWKKHCDYKFLLSHGVETKPGYVTLLGRPIIKKAEGSRIIIGKGVTLVSDTNANIAGINHPCILSTLKNNSEIIIGDGAGLSGSTIVAMEKVTIGQNFGGGANSIIYDNDFHGIKASERCAENSIKVKPVIIGNDVWLGAGSMVLKGVTLGDRAVVGAMSVVTHNIPSDCMFAGNPAKFIKFIENNQ